MSWWDRFCAWIRARLPDAKHRVKDLPYFESFEGYGDPEGVWHQIYDGRGVFVNFQPEQEEAEK